MRIQLNRVRHTTAAALAIVWPVLGQAACAEDPSAMLQRLQRADAATTLDAPGVAPWHLKISVQLFNAKGQPGEQGLIEEWWSGPEMDRVAYVLPEYKATELQTVSGFFRTQGAEQPPLMLELLREQAVQPMPPARDLEGAKPEARKQKFGKAPLDCIMLDRPIKAIAYLPLGLFPTYCMDAGKDSLRASYDYGGQMVLRNRVEDFQGRAVAKEIAISREGIPAASAEVFKLEAKPADPSLFAAQDDLEPTERPLRVGAATMAGYLISQIKPIYPLAAKEKNASGTVIVQALIARDGHVAFTRVVAAPDPDLGAAAATAVKQWLYKPYIVNGHAVEVETTMILTFGGSF